MTWATHWFQTSSLQNCKKQTSVYHLNTQWLKAILIVVHKLMDQVCSSCDLVQSQLILCLLMSHRSAGKWNESCQVQGGFIHMCSSWLLVVMAESLPLSKKPSSSLLTRWQIFKREQISTRPLELSFTPGMTSLFQHSTVKSHHKASTDYTSWWEDWQRHI